MPNEPASEAQRRAMHAAASGKSNIGIPTSVGQKMTKEWGEAHDDAEKEASASVIKKRTPEDRESAMAAKKAEKENESLEDALDNSVNAVRSLLGRMDAYVSRRMDAASTPKSFWSYQAASETPTLEQALKSGAIAAGTTQEQWEQLSPGMRREISRSAKKDDRRVIGGVNSPTTASEITAVDEEREPGRFTDPKKKLFGPDYEEKKEASKKSMSEMERAVAKMRGDFANPHEKLENPSREASIADANSPVTVKGWHTGWKPASAPEKPKPITSTGWKPKPDK